VTDFTGNAEACISSGPDATEIRVVATNGTALHDALLATLAHTA
jgi:hypothetical protein